MAMMRFAATSLTDVVATAIVITALLRPLTMLPCHAELR